MEKRNRRTVDRERGLFVVVEGPDGVGKGEAERAIIQYEQKFGRAVLDTVAFSRAHRKGLPELKDFWNPQKHIMIPYPPQNRLMKALEESSEKRL